MFTKVLGVAKLRKLIMISLIGVGLTALLLTATGAPLSSQGEAAREIGVGAPGTNLYQIAGRIDQDGFSFTGYGYLYDVQGIDPAELFDDPFNTSETTAHITYYATATLTSRAIVTDVVRGIFALDSVGDITFYYHETPSASFDDPESFTDGIPIATATARFQDILNVQSPNRGIAVGNGHFTFTNVESFTFGEETVRFGRLGMVQRVTTFGEGLRTDPFIPRSTVLLAGNAVDTGFRQTFLPTITNTDGQ